MSCTIVALSGKKQSGKNTIADAIIRRNERAGIPCKEFSFAGPLKEMCIRYLDVPRELAYGTDDQKNSPLPHLPWEDFPVQGCRRIFRPGTPYVDGLRSGPMTVREVLQYWGSEIFRKQYPECWLRAWQKDIEEWAVGQADHDHIVVVNADARFPNEVQFLQQQDGKVCRLTRAPFAGDAHQSEKALDPDVFDWSRFDHVLDNAAMTVDGQWGAIEPILIGWGAVPYPWDSFDDRHYHISDPVIKSFNDRVWSGFLEGISQDSVLVIGDLNVGGDFNVN